MTTAAGPGPPTASLSVRLVAAAVIWLCVMLAIGGGVLALAFRSTVEQEFTHRLDAILKAMIAATDIAPDGTVVVVRPLGDPRFDQIFSGWYWEVTEPGGRQIRSRSLWDSVIAPVDGGSGLHTHRITGPNGEPLLVVERDLVFPGAKGPVHLLVAGDLREVSDGVRSFDLLLVSALGLMGVGMAIAVIIQVRYGLRPLRAMAADLRAVRDGARARLSGRYPREVAPLAEAMNGVLDKDAELIERARTHVGNLAHGLKTSLAVISAESERPTDGRVLAEQVRVMRRLIEHHLGRASAVAGAGRALGVAVPVREVAENIAGALGRTFAERKPAIAIDVPAGVVFRGHREDLEEMLGNLMENACKWAAGRVRVSAVDARDGLHLSIEDDGPGMSPEQASEAARRGTRLDESAAGWGLGLSIVSDLVQVNGGEMTFSRSKLGGLSVDIHLPHD
jgi:signal transduction histidine kinase